MTIKRADERDTVTEIGSDVSSGYVGVVTCVGVVICVGVVTCVGVICGPGPEVLGQVMISDALQNLYCIEYSTIVMGPTASLSGRIEGEWGTRKRSKFGGGGDHSGGGRDAYLFPQ